MCATNELKQSPYIGSTNLDLEPNWMDPIVKYLGEGIIPNDKKEEHETIIDMCTTWWGKSFYMRSTRGYVEATLVEEP